MNITRKRALVCLGILLFVCWTYAYDPATCIKCRKSHICNPPDCFCCRDEMPMETHKIPQMVFFTFDDAVNPEVAKHYRDLFDTSRLNPNGCPIRMTLFISHRSTVYKYVREFYEKGMEIASHSVTHSHPNSHTFVREAKKQKENLAKKANIPEDKIVGWRSPFLEPLGDTQPRVLKELGYEYDATLTITKKSSNDKAITPFTLDHGWPYDCKIKPCPTNAHKGFWEVPVVSVKDYKNKYDCVYVDACTMPPPTENLAYQFLWDNFQRYYSTNRAPMGINMHASWFYFKDRKAAMDKFIKQLVQMDDVYIVTVKQVIDWLKNPTPLNQIKTFRPWLCNGSEYEVTETMGSNQSFTNQNIFQNQKSANRPLTQGRFNTWPSQNRQPDSSAAGVRLGSQSPSQQQQNSGAPPSPFPRPPMSPNFQAVRFWWRPPQINRQQMRQTQRQQNVQQQQQVEQQATNAQERRRESLRREMLEKQRRQEALQKANEERIRLENIERQKQELRRQELKRQQERKIAEEKKRQEQIRQEHLEKQRQEELRRQALVKQREQEKQRRQEEMRSRKQQEMRPIEENQRQMSNENQQQRLRVPLRQNRGPIKTNIVVVNKNISPNAQGQSHSTVSERLSRKLDEMLTHSQANRIQMLQQLSLQELQLLQSEVLKRMKSIPQSSQRRAKSKLKTEVKQQIAQINSNSTQPPASADRTIHSSNKMPDIIVDNSQKYFTNEPNTDYLVFRSKSELPTFATRPVQQTIVTERPSFFVTRHLVTGKPRPIFAQETIPYQYETTTMAAMSLIYEKVTEIITDAPSTENQVPFFSVRHVKPENVEQSQTIVQPSDGNSKTKKEPTWSINTFNFKDLDGPWNHASIKTSPKPIITLGPVRKASLKLLPVSIKLFSTNNQREAAPALPKSVFPRPDIFSPIKMKNEEASEPVPISNVHSYDALRSNDVPITKERLHGAPGINKKPADIITTKPSTTTTTTRTTTTTTTSTTTPTTTTTTTSTTTPTTTTSTTTTPLPTPAERRDTIPERKSNTFPRWNSPINGLGQQDRKYQTLLPIPPSWRLGGPSLPRQSPQKVTRDQNNNKTRVGCRQADNCILPNCHCRSDTLPANMALQEVPQIVYITIDGSLNFHSLSKIRKLFAGRVNPNDCNVKGTIFITDAGSSYRIADLLVGDGIELALMGMNSRPYSNIEDLKSGLLLQRQRISESANLPQKSIQGWRSPGFKSLGDKQFEFLSTQNMYDSSVLVSQDSKQKQRLWPFTLDFGLDGKCDIAPCPLNRHPGMWEVPVVPYFGPDNSTACEYVDACTKQPKTAEDTYNYLMENFNLHYKRNRAPFPVRLKQIWFHWYYRDNLKGLFKFLDTVLGYGDVYVTSVTDMLAWVKQPTKLQDINTFKPWKCK